MEFKEVWKLYRKAIAADKKFSDELTREFGVLANEFRYRLDLRRYWSESVIHADADRERTLQEFLDAKAKAAAPDAKE